jgi:hypothetical protein
MDQVITEVKTKRESPPVRTVGPEDYEMEECLARLKKWQKECLLAPHGMDRFIARPEEKK